MIKLQDELVNFFLTHAKNELPIYAHFRPICISRRCNGKFVFKKNKDGTFNKTKVICTLCGKTLSLHRSNTSLKYHLNAMHELVGEGSSSGMRQTTLTEQRRPFIKCACDKLTSAVAKWIAKSCRPINIVEHRSCASSNGGFEYQSTAKSHNNGTDRGSLDFCE